MSKARNTGNLNNSIQITPSGDIRFMHDNNMLMQVSSSGTITTTGTISGSNALSASYALSASNASFASTSTSASYAVVATTASFADALTVAGTLTAQTLVVQTITSSVDFVTGSTRFGSILGNTHVFSGSITMNPNGLFVSSSGNVGIGTITPSFPLEVSSTSTGLLGRFTSNQNEAQIRLVNTSTGGRSYSIGSGGTSSGGAKGFYVYDENAGSTVFAISGSGNIGFGTSSPIEGTQSTSTLSLIPSSSVSGGPLIQFAANGRIRPADTGNRLSIDGNALYLNSTFANNILMVPNGGSVGIGTNSPTNLLHVNGGSDYNTMFSSASNRSGWVIATPGTTNAAASGLVLSSDGSFRLGNASQYQMAMYTNNEVGIWGGGSERMRVLSGGGISVSGPYVSMDGSGPNSFSSPPSGLGYGMFPHSGVGLGISSVANGISLWIGGTERARVNAAGVTIPYQPSFSAYKSSNQEPSSDTILQYDVAEINRGGHYNTSNSRFTAPITGVYAFGVKVWFKQSSTGTIWVHLRKNGSVITEQRMSIATAAADFNTFFPKWIIPLSANDYIEVSGYGDNSNFHSSQTARYSQFYGHLLH